MDHLLTPYGEAIRALFARTSKNTKLGLERTEALLHLLGAPHRELKAIHVAGTNGKGSVVASTEALLRARGLRVGRYTSPHLIDFRERITINGIPIPEETILEFLERWIPASEEMGATFFEITTALALWWLAKQSVDIAVVETGLGGRLDATNVLSPRAAVVTSIALDHTDLLGRTTEAIAKEKGGIFKRGIPAVIGDNDPAIIDLLALQARAAGAAPVIVLDQSYQISSARLTSTGTSFKLSRGEEPAEISTPLLGRHQARNAAMAIAAVDALDPSHRVDLAAASRALADTHLPGRFQRSGKFVFDVAHNPDGATTVRETLEALDLPRPRIAVVSVLGDKDWRGIIRELAHSVDSFIITNAPSAAERAWSPDAAHDFAREQAYSSMLEPDLRRALSRAASDAATVVVTGSFHTVGDAMLCLQVSPFAA